VKEVHREKFIDIFRDIFYAMWENSTDVSKPDLLVEVLKQRLNEDEVQEVMAKANSPPYKERLNDNTKQALGRGAFGCPWFYVRNSKGEEEPFFGSDRYVPSSLVSPSSSLSRLLVYSAADSEVWLSMRISAFSKASAAGKGGTAIHTGSDANY
jgi:hypothetical protein